MEAHCYGKVMEQYHHETPLNAIKSHYNPINIPLHPIKNPIDISHSHLHSRYHTYPVATSHENIINIPCFYTTTLYHWNPIATSQSATYRNWLVVWNMTFIFPYIGNIIIPTDKLIFFRGVCPTTNQINIPDGYDSYN